MDCQKGFSLTEVLTALLLITTLALHLVQQQWQSKHLLNQLVLRTQGSQYLDHIEETVTAQIKKIPFFSYPYHFDIQYKNQEMLMHITWYEKMGSITRKLGFSNTMKHLFGVPSGFEKRFVE